MVRRNKSGLGEVRARLLLRCPGGGFTLGPELVPRERCNAATPASRNRKCLSGHRVLRVCILVALVVVLGRKQVACALVPHGRQ